MKFRIIAISIILLCCIIMYFLYRTEIHTFFARKKGKGLVRPKSKKKSGKRKNKKSKGKRDKSAKAKETGTDTRVVRKKIPDINMSELPEDDLGTGIGFTDDFKDDDFYLDEPEIPDDLDETERQRRKRWDDDWL